MQMVLIGQTTSLSREFLPLKKDGEGIRSIDFMCKFVMIK
jgi:hypothetical protein